MSQQALLDKIIEDRKIFAGASSRFDTVLFKNLTIDYIKDRKGELFFIEPNDLFLQGLCFDMQSQNVFLKIYDTVSVKNQETMRNIVMTDVYRFADFLEKMWGWVK